MLLKTSDWKELSFILGCHEIVNNHPRLLRGMVWGDSDYEGNVLEVLVTMVKLYEQNLNVIKSYIATKYPDFISFEYISTAPNGLCPYCSIYPLSILNSSKTKK